MRRNPTGDEVTAHELALYAVNNAELYRSRIVPVIQNLQRKIKRGIYDPALAPKIWRYVADDAAKRYLREFGGANTGYDYFTVPIRKLAAEEIAAHYSAELKRNPSRAIRSTRRRPKYGERRLRGRTRMTMGGEISGAVDYYFVQVRRGAKWITLAGFPRGEFGKARATEYGKLLARRYPRQKFRVFWPDDARRKNPIEIKSSQGRTIRRSRNLRGIMTHANRLGFGTVLEQDGKTLIVSFRDGSTARAEFADASVLTRWIDDRIRFGRGKFERKNPRRRKNPAPLASRVNGAEVDQAARLFQSFTGHRVTRARQVNLPKPKVGLAIGPVLSISYATTRDGKRENYQHDFRRGARPLLAASQDGRTLLLLSGAYRFTSRGIVDRA